MPKNKFIIHSFIREIVRLDLKVVGSSTVLFM